VIAKPIVDGIEETHRERLAVLRVNIQDPDGRALARRYGVFATPTFIFFNAGGEELWRSIGQIDASQVEASLR
jgi:thiol:disulfide interchange protein